MVAKGSNPSRSSSLRPLKASRLFRFENDLTFRSSNAAAAEHSWLGRCCSSTMTLHLTGDGSVIPVALRERVHNGSGFRPSIITYTEDTTMKPPHTIPTPLRITDQTETTFQPDSRWRTRACPTI